MCASDMTLEPMVVKAGKDEGEGKEEGEGEDEDREKGVPGNGTNGWGVEHECRDFGAVFAWAQRYRASGDGGIL